MERGVVEGGKQAWMSLNSTYNPMTVSLQENKGWEGSLGKGEEARILVFPRENHRWDLKLKTQEQKQNISFSQSRTLPAELSSSRGEF